MASVIEHRMSYRAKRIAVWTGFRHNSEGGFWLESGAMALLAGLRGVQLGGGLAAPACGRLFADIGAEGTCVDLEEPPAPLPPYLIPRNTAAARDAAPPPPA